MPEGGYKKFPLNHFFSSETGNFDIQAKHLNNIGEYVVSSGVSNNGIVGRSDVQAKIFPAQSITVDMFGNAFFQRFPYKLVTHARVFSLLWKCQNSEFDELVGLYFVCLLSKLSQIFSYSNMASWSKIKNFEIPLPVDRNGEIDLEFIRSRMRELEAYLSEAGFEDCTLTHEEAEAIRKLKTGVIKFEERPIYEGVFSVANSHNILKSEVEFGSGTTPYVTAGVSNNSIAGYISYKPELIEPGNSIMIGGKTMVVTYQADEFFSNDSHNLVLRYKNCSFPTQNQYLFGVAALTKALSKIYTWGDSISKAKIRKDVVAMPVDNDGNIDFSFMELFINAIKKIIIASLKENIGIEQSNYKRAINS